MDLKVIIGINLKYYRYKSGLSQEKYYAKYNLSVKYLSACERGEVNLTCDNIEQAIERAGTKAGNKGYDCALSAIEMANLIRNL